MTTAVVSRDKEGDKMVEVLIHGHLLATKPELLADAIKRNVDQIAAEGGLKRLKSITIE